MDFKKRLEAYQATYEIDDLVNPNDLSNLYTLINNQELIDTLQKAVDEQIAQNDITNTIGTIKKLQDARKDLIEQNLQIERLLGIDRKTRKKETQESVSDYITFVKTTAQEFLERQYIKAYCPKCKILVGRIIPAHEHTEYTCKFQCSQCDRWIEIKRKERDIFFDIKEKNKDWRKKYPVEIVQGKDDVLESDDDIFIEDEDND